MTGAQERAEQTRAVEQAIERLGTANLTESEWAAVAEALHEVHAACALDDQTAFERAAVQLSNRAFGAQVHARLGTGRRQVAAVAPTKQSPVLPTVGLVCGGALLLLGWALGGGVLVAATAMLAVFVLGVAVAGTQRVMQRSARRPSRPIGPPVVPPSAELQSLMRRVADAVRKPPDPSAIE